MALLTQQLPHTLSLLSNPAGEASHHPSQRAGGAGSIERGRVALQGGFSLCSGVICSTGTAAGERTAPKQGGGGEVPDRRDCFCEWRGKPGAERRTCLADIELCWVEWTAEVEDDRRHKGKEDTERTRVRAFCFSRTGIADKVQIDDLKRIGMSERSIEKFRSENIG